MPQLYQLLRYFRRQTRPVLDRTTTISHCDGLSRGKISFPRLGVKLASTRPLSTGTKFLDKTHVLTADDRKRIKEYKYAKSALPKADLEAWKKEDTALQNVYSLNSTILQAHALEQLSNHGYGEDTDDIESALSHGFKANAPWGLAIYRIAYGDNAAWERMLKVLEEVANPDDCATCNEEIFRRHRFEIFDNEDLNGATHDQLRENFRRWVMEDFTKNSTYQDGIQELDANLEQDKWFHNGARYDFFLVIDEICLESLDQRCGPVMKLVARPSDNYSYIDGATEEEIEEMGGLRLENSRWDGGETEWEDENVGWMYISDCEYVSYVELLSQIPSNWQDEAFYVRPPMLRLCSPEDEPGSWRKKNIE